jgi:uncharacterized protein (DUF1501 family)
MPEPAATTTSKTTAQAALVVRQFGGGSGGGGVVDQQEEEPYARTSQQRALSVPSPQATLMHATSAVHPSQMAMTRATDLTWATR